MVQSWNMPQATIIGDDSVERIVRLDSGPCQTLAAQGAVICGISDLYPPYHMSRSAKHDRHRLNFILDGFAELRWPGNSHRLTAGDLMVLPAHAPHAYKVPEYLRCVWIQFQTDSPFSFLQGEPVRVQRARNVEHLHEAMRRLQRLITDGDSSKVIDSYGEIILELLLQQFQDETPQQSRAQAVMRKVVHEIESDLRGQWTLERMSKLAFVSPVQLHRYSKTAYDAAPVDLVFRLRMQRAEALLVGTDYTLDVIAQQVGYETPFSFSRAFKRYAGVSPARFRKQAIR